MNTSGDLGIQGDTSGDLWIEDDTSGDLWTEEDTRKIERNTWNAGLKLHRLSHMLLYCKSPQLIIKFSPHAQNDHK